MDIKKLKKAYHSGKLSQYLDEMLASGEKIDKKEIEKHLEAFEKKRNETIKDFKKYIDKEAVPTVDVLYKDTATKEEKEAYKKQSAYAIERAKNILMTVAKKIATKQDINVQSFNDYGHELTGITYFLDQDVVFKKRAWKVDQMRIMEMFNCSRKEAEDHSMISQSYTDYKNAYNLRHSVENFIVNARKEMSAFR